MIWKLGYHKHMYLYISWNYLSFINRVTIFSVIKWSKAVLTLYIEFQLCRTRLHLSYQATPNSTPELRLFPHFFSVALVLWRYCESCDLLIHDVHPYIDEHISVSDTSVHGCFISMEIARVKHLGPTRHGRMSPNRLFLMSRYWH